MALDFPSSPSDGQIFVDPTTGSKYVYVAATTKWQSIQHVGVIVAYGFDKANAAFLTANAAFASANNVGPQIAPTYNTANAAFIQANNAYDSSNSNWAVQNALYTVANSVYNTINSVYNTTNSAYNTINTAFTYANNSNTYANATYLKLTAPLQTITGDVVVSGNLTLIGSATAISSNNLVVGDSMIYLAANNYSGTDILDIGFLANYANGTGANVHTGLLRDASTKQYYLFQGLDIELYANNSAFTPYANGVTNAILNADLYTSNLTLGGTNTINWITSNYITTNSAYALANVANARTYGIANGTITINNISLSGNLNPGTVSMTTQTLTDAANIAWDVSTAAVASVTLGGNRYVNTPTNLKVGTLILHINQDATGGRTLTWSPAFKWPAGVAPVLTTTGSRKDIFSFICDGSNLYGSFLPDVR
jgi:hypothetical protein